MRMLPLLLAGMLASAAPGCASSGASSQPAATDDRPDKEDAGDPSGVKPHHVDCDPAHPEMPCTPDTLPPDFEAPER